MSKERLLTDEEQKHKISQAYTELKPVNLQEWLEAQDAKTAEIVRAETLKELGGWLTRKVYANGLLIPHGIVEALKEGRMPDEKHNS